MDGSGLPNDLSAEALAQRLGKLLTDDEMENVVGGTAEFGQISGISLD
jgi:hypothetical protein